MCSTGADSIIDIQAGDLESAASVAYLYAALDTPALTVQEEEKERETETEFYQGIVPTHPIPVSELTTHVTSRHSDNKATFVEQFKVKLPQCQQQCTYIDASSSLFYNINCDRIFTMVKIRHVLSHSVLSGGS